MIVAICSTGSDLDAELDSRFGRCARFIFFNTDDGSFTAENNAAKDAAGGAGALAVQQLVNHGTGVLLAPEVGPQAMDALKSIEILVFRQGNQTNGARLIDAWKNHRLEEQHMASVAGMHRA